MDANAMYQRVTFILSRPTAFFDSLKKEKGVEQAFIFFAILSIISTALGFLMMQLFGDLSYKVMSAIFGQPIAQPQYSPLMLIILTVLGYGFTLGFTFVVAGILHLWIMLFGGRAEYSKTYQLYVYSTTPGLIFGWVPFVGFFTIFYDLILLIIGTQKLHGLSKTRSIMIYVIPAIIFSLLILALFVLMIIAIRMLGQNIGSF